MENCSRFGGVPLLGRNDDWPTCGRCSRPLNLLLQLNLATLPKIDTPLTTGLLQVFYCTRMDFNEGGYCDDFEAFSPCHDLRILPDTTPLTPARSIPEHIFPAMDIIGWEKFDDLPNGVEHDRLGLRYVYDFQPGITSADVHWDAGNVHFYGLISTNDGDEDVASAIASAAPRDKLGGWPAWVQGVEYPTCPKCKQEMEYFFQIDSEDNVPFMFGDVGCGHISFCRNHPDVLAFTWACS